MWAAFGDRSTPAYKVTLNGRANQRVLVVLEFLLVGACPASALFDCDWLLRFDLRTLLTLVA